MLKKMVLISPEYFKRLQAQPPRLPRVTFKRGQHPYDRLVKLREAQDPVLRQAKALREPVNVSLLRRKRKRRKSAAPPPPLVVKPSTTPRRPRRLFSEEEYISEPAVPVPKVEEGEEDEGEDYFVPGDELREIEDHLSSRVGKLASEYLSPYVHNRRYLDTDFGIRREEDGTFMIGNSPVTVDEQGDIIIHGERYKGTAGLWELLTKKNINQSLVTKRDLGTYKNILELTNAHLENNESFNRIKTTRGTKYKTIISKLFASKPVRWTEYK